MALWMAWYLSITCHIYWVLSLNITMKANTYLVTYAAQNISRDGKSTSSFKLWIHFRDGIANCLTRWARWWECQWHTHKLHMAWVNQYCNALVTEYGIICISVGLVSTSDPTILFECSLFLHQQFRDCHMGGVRCVLQSGYVMSCYQLGRSFSQTVEFSNYAFQQGMISSIINIQIYWMWNSVDNSRKRV